MKKKLFVSVIFVFVALISFPNLLPAKEKIYTIKYAHIGQPGLNAMHGTAIGFKYFLEKNSGGRFKVKIYPGGSLGKELDLMEAVRNNVIQINQASMGGLFRIFPPALLAFAPYVFRNEAVAGEVVNGPFGQKLLDAFTAETGIKGLIFTDIYTFLGISNNVREIRKPADMKGIKFRAMDSLQTKMFQAMGASAVPISFRELYTAMQTGVVNGQTNPPALVSWMKFYEVQKYFTNTTSQYGYQWLICNQSWYNKLSPSDKILIREAAFAAQTACRGLSLYINHEETSALKKKGMKIYTLTQEEFKTFQNLVKPVCLEWLREQMDPKWVDEFQEAIKVAEKKLGYN